MKITMLLLALMFSAITLAGNISSPHSLSFPNNCIKMFGASQSKNPRLKLLERYWDHTDVDFLAEKIMYMKPIEIYQEPFRLGAKLEENDHTLQVIVTSLVSPRFVFGRGWFSWSLINRRSDNFDATLPKVMTGILKGALQRKLENPKIKHLQILAPSVVNKRLSTLLKDFGFTLSKKNPAYLDTGQYTIGESEFLELWLDLTPVMPTKWNDIGVKQ